MAWVRLAAAARWPHGEPPLDSEVQLGLTYFHDSAPLDMDNMIKPIQDALIGLVYADDRQVASVISSRRDLDGSFRLNRLSPALAEGFLSRGPFVHVRVESRPDPQELP
jgi:crossover junction endodeoxyribonuclease RusA